MSTPPPAPPSRAAPWFRALRLLVVVGILGLLAWRGYRDRATLLALRFDGGVGDVVLVFALSSVGLLLLPAAYLVQLRDLGLLGPRLAPFAARIWLQAYFFRYVPGKVMLVAERIRLGRQVGLSATVQVVLLLWETLLLMVGAVVVGIATLGTASADPALRRMLWIALGATVLGVLAFPWVLRVAARLPGLSRLSKLAEVRLSWSAQLALVGLYGATWTCFGLAYALTARWFFPAASGHGALLTFWFVVAYVVGFVSSVAPGGLGVREGILLVGVTPVLGGGPAVALAVASRLWMTLVELLWVGLAVVAAAPPSEGPVDGHGQRGAE